MFPASWADFRGWLRVDGGSRVLKCFWPGREVEMQVQSPLALDRGSVSHGSYQCPEQGTSIKILLFPDRNTGFDTQFNGFRGLAVGGAGGTVSVCCHWMKAKQGRGQWSYASAIPDGCFSALSHAGPSPGPCVIWLQLWESCCF